MAGAQTMMTIDMSQCKYCHDTIVKPHMLSCLHSFCEGCVSKMCQNKPESHKDLIICPTCNQDTLIDEFSIGSLPYDYIALKATGAFKGNEKCTACKNGDMAVNLCQDCDGFLCQGCSNAHERMRVFEEHKMVPMTDLDDKEPEQQGKRLNSEVWLDARKCQIHKPLICQQYCLSCNQLVCKSCNIVAHSDQKMHIVVSLREANLQAQNQAAKLKLLLKQKWAYYKSIAAEFELKKQENQQDFDKRLKQIDEALKMLQQTVENEFEKHRADRNAEYTQYFDGLEPSVSQFENLSKKSERLIKYAKEMLQHEDKSQLLLLYPKIKEQIMRIKKDVNSTPVDLAQVAMTAKFNTKDFKSYAAKVFKNLSTPSQTSKQQQRALNMSKRGPATASTYAETSSSFDESALDAILVKELPIKINSAAKKALPTARVPPSSAKLTSPAVVIKVVSEFGTTGSGVEELNSPHGFCLGPDGDIYVADTKNHRVQIWNLHNGFKGKWGTEGVEEGMLMLPRKVLCVPHKEELVVCDRGTERSRMQVFTLDGQFKRRIWLKGVNIVAALALTHQLHIAVLDSLACTVHVFAQDGKHIYKFNCSDHLLEPSDLTLHGSDFYICDYKAHCIAVFSDNGELKHKIGDPSLLSFPSGIDVSEDGSVIVADSHRHNFHLNTFDPDGRLKNSYDFKSFKISRICGIKKTSDGKFVTLSKDNHKVFIFALA